MMNTVYPVILCGGSGTRLWPLSRKSYPKQFVPLIGETSLLQDCAERMRGPSDNPYAKPLILTNEAFRFCSSGTIDGYRRRSRPDPYRTRGAQYRPRVLAAALYLAASDPEAVMLVAPSDHVIPDNSAFHPGRCRRATGYWHTRRSRDIWHQPGSTGNRIRLSETQSRSGRIQCRSPSGPVR